MRAYILVDDDDIVRCMATDECCLHKDKIAAGMKKLFVECKGTVGDGYDEVTGTWTPHPENYPTESKLDIEGSLVNLLREKTGLESLEAELGIDKTDEKALVDNQITELKTKYQALKAKVKKL